MNGSVAQCLYATNNPVDEYTEVRLSPIEGFGLFAKKLIPEGFAWFHARQKDVIVITRDQYSVFENSFKPPLIYQPRLINQFSRCLLTYSFYHPTLDALIFCLDNARYVNYSESPNSALNLPGIRSVALRNIHPGEEITENYSLYPKARWVRPLQPG